MTVHDAYRALERDGRAVVVGTLEAPEAWLTRIDGGYGLCSVRTDQIRLIQAGATYPDAVQRWITVAGHAVK